MAGIFKKTKPKSEDDENAEVVAPSFIDLSKYGGKKGPSMGKGSIEIKVAEIDGFEDLRELSTLIYEGKVLILDFTTISNDELALKRTLSELKRLVADVGGDIAGISQNLLIVAPKNVYVDRNKIRRSGNAPKRYGAY